MRNTFTLMVMGATALSSFASTAAWADVIPTPIADPADGTTIAVMQAQCDSLAALHDTGNGDIWAGVSVNMFGDQYASSGSWSDSEYDYTADFASTFRHAYSCNITQAVYHAATTIHHRAEGIYVIAGDFGESEDAVRGNCAAFTRQGDDDPQPSWYGDPFHGGNPDKPHCMFQGTPRYDEDIPESWDPPVLIATEDGGYVDQDQTDSLLAHEDHGGPVQANGGPYHIGQVVICISPSTSTKKGVPGAWRQQNGYTGDKCTTDWFVNHAVWGSGTESSNGTYISVPDYNLY